MAGWTGCGSSWHVPRSCALLTDDLAERWGTLMRRRQTGGGTGGASRVGSKPAGIGMAAVLVLVPIVAFAWLMHWLFSTSFCNEPPPSRPLVCPSCGARLSQAQT